MSPLEAAEVVAEVYRRQRRVEQGPPPELEPEPELELELELEPVPVPVQVPELELVLVPVPVPPRCLNADTSCRQFPRLHRRETSSTYRHPLKQGRPV